MTIFEIAKYFDWVAIAGITSLAISMTFYGITESVIRRRNKKYPKIIADNGMILPHNPPRSKALEKILCWVNREHDYKRIRMIGEWKTMGGDRPPGRWYHFFHQCRQCERMIETGAELMNAAGEPY